MPEAVSNETNDDLRSDLSAEWDKQLATTEDAPAAEPALEAPAAPEAQAETAKAAADRARDEHGRFVKKASETIQSVLDIQIPKKDADQPTTEQTQLQAPQTRVIGPPPGWSVAAKAEFDKLSPAIKEAVAKREEEVSNGFAKLQAFKGLEPYAERAASAGTNLAEVTKRFFAAEELLATDFLQGTVGLCKHFNVDPTQLGRALLGQGGGHQQQAPQTQTPEELQAIKSELAQVKAELQAVLQAPIRSEVDAFFSDPANKYAENVREEMKFLLENNRANSLKEAYEKACKNHPEISELFINERLEQRLAEQQRKASEARRASGSLNPGSPIPGASTGGGSSQKSVRQLLEESWGSATI